MSTVDEDLAQLEAEIAAFRAPKPRGRPRFGVMALFAAYIAGAAYALYALLRSGLLRGGSGEGAAGAVAGALAFLMLVIATVGLGSAVKRTLFTL